ncbi:MAG: hypothetical protein O3B65_02550 [Chloroflexi bacterium]|nr:hypothetical protein [Chloroflexota bacterium]
MSESEAWAVAASALDMFPGDEVFQNISRLIQQGQLDAALEAIATVAKTEVDSERLGLFERIRAFLAD